MWFYALEMFSGDWPFASFSSIVLVIKWLFRLFCLVNLTILYEPNLKSYFSSWVACISIYLQLRQVHAWRMTYGHAAKLSIGAESGYPR